MRRFLSILVFLFFLYVVINLGRSIWEVYKIRDTVTEAERRLAVAREENERLKKRLETVSGDSFVEKEARERLGMVKEGETVVIMPSPGVAGGSEAFFANENLPNWEKWMRLFFK